MSKLWLSKTVSKPRLTLGIGVGIGIGIGLWESPNHQEPNFFDPEWGEVGYAAAENIASGYGYYIHDFMWDKTADLFARDGWKELSCVGAYVVRERIRQSLKIR